MDTWVEASVRADRGKPAGIIPSAIHWPEGEIGGLGKNWWNPENHSPKSKLYVWPSAMSLMLNTLLLTNYMTDDPKYLEPIWSMAKIRLAYLKNIPEQPPVPGSEAWCGSMLGGLSSIVAKYMLLSKNTKFDQLLKTDKNPYVAFRFHGDRELLVTALHNNAKALRINFAGYTSEVRYTDRVLRFPAVFRDNGIYPTGIPTIHQPNIYLLYATLTGDPGDALYFPINAVRWITPPRDIAALVTETGKDRFAAELFHFGEKPREMSAVFYLLDSGEYNFKIFTLGKNTKLLTDKRMLISNTKIPISFKLPVKTPCKLEISPTS
jgi:hypothetical protein